MDAKQKYDYWEDIADYDLETARAMLISGRYLYVVFMCQQSVEKLVKGLYLLFCAQEPPRSHNIAQLFKQVSISGASRLHNVAGFQEQHRVYEPLFVKLLAYYIAERYPSYKEKLSQAVGQAEAADVLESTEEVCKWLKSLKEYA